MGIGKGVAETAKLLCLQMQQEFLFGWLFKLGQGLWESVRKARPAVVREGKGSGCHPVPSLHFWAMGQCGFASEASMGTDTG